MNRMKFNDLIEILIMVSLNFSGIILLKLTEIKRFFRPSKFLQVWNEFQVQSFHVFDRPLGRNVRLLLKSGPDNHG